MLQPPEPSPRDDRRNPRGALRGTPGEHPRPVSREPRRPDAEADAPAIHGAWLVAPMMLLALASALRLAARGKDSDFAICFGLLLGLGVVWIGMRLCLPPPAPPVCPHCRRRALVRLVPESACGARCLHCGWRDETADARLLAAPLAAPVSPRGAAHAATPLIAPRERTRPAGAGGRAPGRSRRGFGRGRRLR